MKIEFRSCKIDKGDVLVKFNDIAFVWLDNEIEWLVWNELNLNFDTYWNKAK